MMTRLRGTPGLLALIVSAALIQGCDARTPLESAPGGPLAASAPGTFPPPPPVGVTPTFRADSFAVELVWAHDGTQVASQWRVERLDLDSVWTQVAADSGVGGRFLDASFPVGPARTLEYRVLVCNAAGCGTSRAAAVGVPALPAPDELTAVAASGGVSVAWEQTDGALWITQVARRTTATGYSPRVTTAPGVQSFHDTRVQQGITYYYMVRTLVPAGAPAVGLYRPTAWSQEAAVTPGRSGAGGPPVARADSARGTGAASAVLYGAVTPNGRQTTVRFQWGTSPSLAGASTTAPGGAGDGFGVRSVSTALSGLSAGTPYYFRLIAQNAAGADSSAILPLRLAAPAAAAVTGTFALPQYAVVLSWTAPDAQSFRVERRSAGIWSTLVDGHTGTTFTDTNVALDSIYLIYYRVTACNDLGCSAPSETSVTTVPLPVPSAFGAQVQPGQVQLDWNGNGAPGDVFYQVRRRTPGTPFRPRVTTAPGATSFTDGKVDVDSTYLYQVRALLPTGSDNRVSAWSGLLTVAPAMAGTTPGVTTGPAHLSAATLVLTGTVDVRSAGTTAFFEVSENPDLVPFTTRAVSIPSGSSGPTQVSHTTSPPRNTLYYRLVARNAAGTVRGAIRSSVRAPHTLAAPTGVRGWFDGAGYTVQLRWDSVAGATSYHVTVSDPGRSTHIFAPTPPSMVHTRFRLDSARALTYVVRACSPAGCGPAADPVSVDIDALVPPGGVEARALDIDRAEVKWDDLSTGETGFFVERRDPGQSRFSVIARVQMDGVTEYVDTGRTPGATYEYRVRAYIAPTRISNPSDAAQVTLPSS